MRSAKNYIFYLPESLRVAPEVTSPKDSVIDGAPDNEGADDLFKNRDWRDVDVDGVLKNSTSVWFLSSSGLEYYLPSIVASVLLAISEGNSTPSIQLFDHLEARIRLGEERDEKLSVSARLLVNFLREKILPVIDSIDGVG